jgi:hypothetical protein
MTEKNGAGQLVGNGMHTLSNELTARSREESELDESNAEDGTPDAQPGPERGTREETPPVIQEFSLLNLPNPEPTDGKVFSIPNSLTLDVSSRTPQNSSSGSVPL